MKKLLKSLMLLGIAVGLSVVLLPLGIVWTIGEILVRFLFPHGRSAGTKTLGYLGASFHAIAVGIDQIGNAVCRDMLNRLLITSSGYKFGKVQETISSVLGKNQRDGTLTALGKLIAGMLDFLDPEHCKKSIQNFI